MSIQQTWVCIAVWVTSSLVFAQTKTEPPPNASDSTEILLPSNPCSSSGKPADQDEILTDTMGVDFGPYLARMTQIVRKNWYQLMPPSVYPPILKQGKVSIEFVVLKDGKINGMTVHRASGDVALDRAAWGSIAASGPFAALPAEFPGQRIGLRFFFYYNATFRISISPCADVRVPTGSTLQFFASGEGTTNASVTWSISGAGCSKSACGSISDTGLYTAPANIPDPPTVVVEAASRTGISITGKSKLIVVPANPSH